MRRFKTDAKVAELADAPDLGSGGETRGGSSPPFRTSDLQRIESASTHRYSYRRLNFAKTNLSGHECSCSIAPRRDIPEGSI